MKKNFKLLTILLVIACVFFITGCTEEKSVDYDSLVKDLETTEGQYLKENDNYYNPSTSQLIKEKVNGLIAVGLYDFDGDNENEVLSVKVKDNSIVLYLYEAEDDKLKEADSIVLFENYLDSPDYIDLDCFIKIIDNKPYIFAESFTYSNVTNADGFSWAIRKISFDGNKFFDIVQNEFSASYVDDEDLASKKEFVKETDLKADSLIFEEYGKSLFNQNSDNAAMLFEINRDKDSNFKQSDYYNSKETKVKYGTTKYLNNLEENNDIELLLK